MKINEFPGGILYIEDVFTKHKEFIDLIEKENDNPEIHSVIPKWSIWRDGIPVKITENGQESWRFVDTEEELERLTKDYANPEDFKDSQNGFKQKELKDRWGPDGSPYQPGGYRGFVKIFNWDLSSNRNNEVWPRINVDPESDLAHKSAFKAIKMIEDPLVEVIEIWKEKIGARDLQYLSRNYCLRKYDIGGSMGPHVDRNYDNKDNTMDWTALIYLNDDYEGGELVFSELDFKIKPRAGSVVFLPCNVIHEVEEVKNNFKYYLFFFFHLDLSICTSLGEPYHQLNKAIKQKMGKQEQL